MNLTVLQGAVELGLLYSLVALGLYLSYRTLDLADLTTDSSFTLGAACSAMLTTLGHPVLGLLAALGAMAARLGGAPMGKGAARVLFWGALAMGASALIGQLFGTGSAG